MAGYLRRYRNRILPMVKDFSKDMDFYKSRDVSSLSFNDWFWLHPSSYKLIYFGSSIIGFLLYFLVGFYAWLNFSFKLPSLLLFLLGFFSAKDLFKKFRDRVSIVGVSFYDVHLRDYFCYGTY